MASSGHQLEKQADDATASPLIGRLGAEAAARQPPVAQQRQNGGDIDAHQRNDDQQRHDCRGDLEGDAGVHHRGLPQARPPVPAAITSGIFCRIARISAAVTSASLPATNCSEAKM